MQDIIVIVGASRGIGKELAKYFTQTGKHVVGISRSHAQFCQWIKGDIATEHGVAAIAEQLANVRIKTLVFCAGIWEAKGFMPDFSFASTKYSETRDIMNINVVAPVELTKLLINQQNFAIGSRAIYLGALSGIDNKASDQVAYCASKFALRGSIESLRVAYAKKSIGFTVINPGNVATEEVMQDIKDGYFSEQTPISIDDIAKTIEWLMSLSSNVDIGDINMMQV